MTQDDATQSTRLRKAILRYIYEFPLAADTAEGILASWLPRQGFECAPDHIAAVLERLVADGSLLARRLPDGQILYSPPSASTRGANR